MDRCRGLLRSVTVWASGDWDGRTHGYLRVKESEAKTYGPKNSGHREENGEVRPSCVEVEEEVGFRS
jgi:hypothetical protein